MLLFRKSKRLWMLMRSLDTKHRGCHAGVNLPTWEYNKHETSDWLMVSMVLYLVV